MPQKKLWKLIDYKTLFGILLLLLPLLLLSKLYSFFQYSRYIDAIIFPGIIFTWFFGFLLLVLLYIADVLEVKFYFIWMTLFISSLVFTLSNNRAIAKYIDEINEKFCSRAKTRYNHDHKRST